MDKVPNNVSLRNLQLDVTSLRQEIPKKIEDLFQKDIGLIKEHCKSLNVNTNDQQNAPKLIHKSYFDCQISKANKLTDISDRCVRLNSSTDAYLKVIDYLKKD